MRQLREILRLLSAGGVAVREIARRTGVAPSTVRETVKRLGAAGLSWPLPERVSDAELEALLYQNAGKKPGHRRYPEPDWAATHQLARAHYPRKLPRVLSPDEVARLLEAVPGPGLKYKAALSIA